MSLVVGFLHNNTVYMAADGRITREYPVIGTRYYDYFQKLGYLEYAADIWLASVGIIPAANRIVNELEQKNIETIDFLCQFGANFFKNNHQETLRQYDLHYTGENDRLNFISLLFGGIDKRGNAKLCWIDSADDYKQKWFGSTGDFLFNKIDNGEIDRDIDNRLQALIKHIAYKTNATAYIIKSLKNLFNYVSSNDIGVSPLMYFVKISTSGIQYREFYALRRSIHRIKSCIDSFLHKIGGQVSTH